MATKQASVALLLPLALLFLFGSSPAVAQLQFDYYRKTCPNVEAIVRKEMKKIISVAPSLAGPLLRLHFHDCFVRVSYINQSQLQTLRSTLIFGNSHVLTTQNSRAVTRLSCSTQPREIWQRGTPSRTRASGVSVPWTG
jgi:hypothetical protein